MSTATPELPEHAARHARRAVASSWVAIVGVLLFLVAAPAWAYLRLLLCWGSPARPLCSDTFVAPLVLFIVAAGAFAMVLASLSALAGRRGSALKFADPRRPKQGLAHLPRRGHRHAVRGAHTLVWSAGGIFGGFVLWFYRAAPSELGFALAVGAIALAVISTLTTLAEPS